jgi:hypothetical protein
VNSKLARSIKVIDHERNEDYIYGSETFVDLEIENKEKETRESPEVQGHKGIWSMIIVCGHRKGEAYWRELRSLA